MINRATVFSATITHPSKFTPLISSSFLRRPLYEPVNPPYRKAKPILQRDWSAKAQEKSGGREKNKIWPSSEVTNGDTKTQRPHSFWLREDSILPSAG
jgi:hypothetical protein